MAIPLRATGPEKNPLSEEAVGRLDDARAQKDLSMPDIEECYYFAAPRRVRSQSSRNNPEVSPHDADELQTSLGFEVAEDFMTMLIDSFLPQSGRWAERRVDPFLPEGTRVRLEQEARKQDEQIFDAVRGSNFHAELAKQGVPDAAIGAIAMTVSDPGHGRPFLCTAVPIRELEMNIGPDGRIDDRFIVKMAKYSQLEALLPDIASFPAEIARKIKDDEDDEIEVIWGWWRDWKSRPDEAWQHVVLVGEDVVHEARINGEGSCQLVLGRFGATPDFAWPDGPLVKSLPDLRQIDETDAAFVENLDFTLRPPFTYPDDGVLNFEDGIEPGMGYPRRAGTAPNDIIDKIWQPNPIDSAMFQHEAKQRRVRRLHYVDHPEQVGKTPPTASQWLDEMVEAQKKIGTPGYAFWREFPYEAFQRFRYLAEQRGAIKPITFNNMPVSLQAYNPAQRAQENQEVLQATRLIQIGASAFPQIWQVAVDPLDTLNKIKAKLGDKLVTIRDPEDMAKTVDTVAKLGGVGGPRLSGGISGAGGGGVPGQ
jgi:hypothetical protein